MNGQIDPTLVQVIRTNKEIGHCDNPKFDKAHKYQDWRNYIPDEVRSIWKDLTVESRIMAYLTAKRQVQFENWK